MSARDHSKPIMLDGESIRLSQVEKIANGAPLRIAESVKKKMAESRSLVEKLAKGSTPIYGVNTGFGFLANTCISASELKKLQVNFHKDKTYTKHKPAGSVFVNMNDNHFLRTKTNNTIRKRKKNTSREQVEKIGK